MLKKLIALNCALLLLAGCNPCMYGGQGSWPGAPYSKLGGNLSEAEATYQHCVAYARNIDECMSLQGYETDMFWISGNPDLYCVQP